MSEKLGSSRRSYPFSRRATEENLQDTESEGEGAEARSPQSNSPEVRPSRSFEIDPKVPTRKLSAGPSSSNRRIISRSNLDMSSDSDDDSEQLPRRINAGEYDPSIYDNLNVKDDVKEIFQYISKYAPQHLNLDYKFKPFIPDFIPAVGDVDAFLKIIPPDQNLSGDDFDWIDKQLGLIVLDEPTLNQSDPALLHLQLRASSINVASDALESLVVKKVDDVEKQSKIVDKWIKDVSDLHRHKPAAIVKYARPMPELDDLMQEWPEEFEKALKQHKIPDAKFCGTLSEYIDIICAIFDIPIYENNRVHSLHLLYSLYVSTQNSQIIQEPSENDKESKEELFENAGKPDHLVLE